MKKIYPLLIAATLFLGSCELNREPETVLVDLNFWKTENDLRGACNRMYIDLPGFWNDLRSDELIGISPNNVSSGNWNIPGTSDDDWTKPFNRIGVANNILVKGADAPLTDEIKNRWLAEAYFFRAYNYFELVKKYGDVPMILKIFDTTDDPEIKKGSTPREEVLQQCYKDFEFAATWLPDIDNLKDANWGRFSRSAALAMIMRIGLYEGTFSKYHGLGSDYKAHLKRAIDAAETIFSEKRHDLYPDFQKMFLFEGEGRQNKENILVKVYGPNDAGIITHSHSRNMEGIFTLTRQMVDRFLYTDGLPREQSPLKIKQETAYDDIFKNRDPRLGMTVFHYEEDAYKGPYTPFSNNHCGYPIKKGFMLAQWQTSSKETVDKMLIRYAEVLISYAEALYEYNGSITNDQLEATVNYVRQRAGFNVKLTNEFVQANGLDMLNEIRRERMIEFIDENLHYNDIIRWKTAEKVLPVTIIGLKFIESETVAKRSELANRLTDTNGNLNGVKVYDQEDLYVIEKAETRSFNPARDYLYPIPSYEVATSGGNIKQNPKWN